MDKAQFTPGPWAIHPRHAVVVPLEHVLRPVGGAEDPAVDLATYAQEICLLHWPDPHRSESEVEANGRLIAAAPELLEALGLVRDNNRQGVTGQRAREAWARANAAIDKALGR